MLCTISLAANVTFYIGWKNQLEPQPKSEAVKDTINTNGDFICQKLNFTPEQRQKYQISRRKFNRKAVQIIDSLHNERKLLLRQLSEENTDSVSLYEIADQIGEYHALLKKHTIHHFFDLKQICNQQQCEKLSKVYDKIIDIEENNHRFGRGKGYGRRNRWRHGN